MATQTASKPINPTQLEAELVAGIQGFALHGVWLSGGRSDTNALKSIYAYDAGGNSVDLPDTTAPVIANHVAVFATALDQPVTDLQTARSAYTTDAAALQAAKTAVTNANATIQGLAASPSIANLTSAVKAFCQAQAAQADVAILASLSDLADGELAIANALAALKARG